MNPATANLGDDAILGLATLGKTAAALGLVVAFIFLCSAVLKRIGPARGSRAGALRVVTSAAVGTRERVVVVELEGIWLVLGVASGRVNKLHSLPAPEHDSSAHEAPNPARPAPADSRFAARFAQALKHHASQTRNRR